MHGPCPPVGLTPSEKKSKVVILVLIGIWLALPLLVGVISSLVSWPR